MTSTTTQVAGAARGGRAPVEDVTVILLPGPDAADLDDPVTRPVRGPATDAVPDPECDPERDPGLGPVDGLVDDLVAVLDAVQAQTIRPRRVLVAGLDQALEGAERVLDHPLATVGRVPLLLRRPLRQDAGAAPVPRLVVPRWEVVEDARRVLPVHRGHWLWFLAPDSRPEPGALAALAAAARRSSRVGVVGPKLVRADDPRMLRSLGHHLTPAGRSTDAWHPGLVDQGQLDLRQDVLGVPLVGSLVDSAVLDEVGGLDRAFGEDGVDGLDLGWRSQLAGHRVVVAPEAVVRQGEAGLGVVDRLRTRRRQRQLALARGPLLPSAWRAVGVVLTSLLAAAVLLLVKRPAEAAGEWADVRAALAPARGWGARRRFGRRRAVRFRDLAGLHSRAGSGWRTTLETVGEALDPRSRRAGTGPGAGPRAAVATGPVSDEFTELAGEAPRGWWSWPLTAAVLLTLLVTAWWWRGLGGALDPGGVGLAGPELGPATTDAAGLIASALDGWRGGGLGHSAPAETWLLPAAGTTWVVAHLPGAGPTPAGPALAWLLVLAGPAGVVTAYLALRRATRRRWVRSGLALAWAGLSPMTVAAAEGRLGPVLVHVLAPLLLAGVVVCAERTGGPRRTAACFATVLGVALAAHWVPAVLLLGTVAGLLLGLLGRGAARWRGAVLAVLPWGLLLPWLPAVLQGPVRLLGGAGATVAAPALPLPAPVWQTFLLHPGGPVDPGASEALPLWLTAPLWLAALGALLLPGPAGRRAGVLVTGALLGLGAALLAQRSGLGRLPAGDPQAGLVVAAWPGTALSVAGAALLLATGLLVDAVLTAVRAARAEGTGEGRRRFPAARTGGPVLAVLLLVPPTLLGGSGFLPDLAPRTLEVGADPLPAVAAEQSRGPAAVRTLVLEPVGEEQAGAAVRADLVGAEPEPGRILRDRAAELATGAQAQEGGTGEVVDAVTALVRGAAPDEVARAVTDLGAGYVLLRADADHPLAAQVDRVSGMTRVSSPADQVLWRRTDADAARIRVLDAEGRPAGQVPVTGPHARAAAELGSLPGAARLEVAEGDGWARHAQILVDGDEVAVDAGTAGRVTLPEGASQLRVEMTRRAPVLHLVTLGLALMVVVLALPLGRADQEPRRARGPVPRDEEGR